MARRWQFTGGLLVTILWFCQPAAHCDVVIDFVPNFGVSQIYDDNLFFSPTRPQADLVTNEALGFSANIMSPTQTMSFQYQTIAQQFLNHPQFNNVGENQIFNLIDNQQLSASANLSVQDMFFTGSEAVGFISALPAPNGLTQPPILNPLMALALISVSPGEFNLFNVALNDQLSRLWSFSFDLFQDLMTFGPTEAFMQGGSATISYQLMPTLSAGFGENFYDFRYSSGSGSQAHFIAASLNWTPDRQVVVRASAGPTIYYPTEGPGGLGIQPSFNVSASYTSKRWQAALAGGQVPGIYPGPGGAGFERYATTGFNYVLTKKLSFFGSVNYFQFYGIGPAFYLISYGGGISYRMTHWLLLYAEYMQIHGTALSVTPITFGGLPNQSTATANLFTFGISVSFEAFRWTP